MTVETPAQSRTSFEFKSAFLSVVALALKTADTGACTVSFGDLADQMAALGKDMDMDIRAQREDTFQAMHRI